MAEHYLLESILDDGIREPRFVNGSLLTAEDLSDGLEANRRRHWQLGKALGAGVVQGLEIGLANDGGNGEPAALSITRGLAVNPQGQWLSLAVDLPRLTLDRQASPGRPSGSSGAGLFAPCAAPAGSPGSAAAGLYLLLLAPDSGLREQRPVRGLDTGKVIGCGSRYAVEGVSFRLAQVSIEALANLSPGGRAALTTLMTTTDAAGLSRLRNHLAHAFFGTEERLAALRDPGAAVVEPGALAALRAGANPILGDCDVPLALLLRGANRVRFLDMWAVRRLATPPTPVRGEALGAPMLLQFRRQIADLIGPAAPPGGPSDIEARDYFRFLPAVADIPLAGIPGAAGFDIPRFFAGRTVRGPMFMEGRKLGPLVQRSLAFQALDLESAEMLWLYLVRENLQTPLAAPPAPPYLVFAHGHTPYQGDARMDLSYWNFSNYSISGPPPGG